MAVHRHRHQPAPALHRLQLAGTERQSLVSFHLDTDQEIMKTDGREGRTIIKEMYLLDALASHLGLSCRILRYQRFDFRPNALEHLPKLAKKILTTVYDINFGQTFFCRFLEVF
jgi:hypothetical protein